MQLKSSCFPHKNHDKNDLSFSKLTLQRLEYKFTSLVRFISISNIEHIINEYLLFQLLESKDVSLPLTHSCSLSVSVKILHRILLRLFGNIDKCWIYFSEDASNTLIILCSKGQYHENAGTYIWSSRGLNKNCACAVFPKTA